MEAISQVKKQRKDIPDSLTQDAETTIMSILSNVRGSSQDQAVESWGLSARDHAAQGPKMFLSLRIAHGVAVSLSALKRAFGKSWADGVVTLSNLTHSIPAGLSLPVSEHGSVEALHGRDSLIVYAALLET